MTIFKSKLKNPKVGQQIILGHLGSFLSDSPCKIIVNFGSFGLKLTETLRSTPPKMGKGFLVGLE